MQPKWIFRNIAIIALLLWISRGKELMYGKSGFAQFVAMRYDPEIGDPDSGVAPGTAFEDLPDDWVCPDCGVSKDMFEKA